MKRGLLEATTVWTTVFAFLLVMFAAADADAKRKRKPKKRKAAIAKVNEQALGEMLGPYKFGMTKDQVLGVLRDLLEEKYAEKISASEDTYKQDKLRRERNAKLATIKKTFVSFEGKQTGWDVSLIDDQFRHKTDESMLVYDEFDPETGMDQRRFFFFHGGKLYKMFIALNSDNLKANQRSFAFLRSLMEAKYGAGTVRNQTDRDGNEVPYLIEWASNKYHVFALDKMGFYGTFCVAIADSARERQVEVAREAVPVKERRNNVIDSVVDKDNKDVPTLNEGNSNVVDTLLN